MSRLDRRFEPEGEVRRFEVINGAIGRRRWSGDERARILEETLAPGAVVSAEARRHELTPHQLFTWRREVRQAADTPAGLRAGGDCAACGRSAGGGPPISIPAHQTTRAKTPHRCDRDRSRRRQGNGPKRCDARHDRAVLGALTGGTCCGSSRSSTSRTRPARTAGASCMRWARMSPSVSTSSPPSSA